MPCTRLYSVIISQTLSRLRTAVPVRFGGVVYALIRYSRIRAYIYTIIALYAYPCARNVFIRCIFVLCVCVYIYIYIYIHIFLTRFTHTIIHVYIYTH